jgi:hypothetical protein
VAFDLATAEPADKFDVATAAPVDAPAARSLPAQVARAVGRTVRAGVQGAAAFPLSIYDAGASAIEGATGIPQTKYGPKLKQALTSMGLPEAENANERIAEDVAGGMAGAGGMVKAGQLISRGGNALVSKIGELLSTAPATQVVAGGTGPGAAGVVREAGGGPGAQLAAGVAGSLVPTVGPTLLAEGARRLVRGGETGRQRVAQNIETFEDAGAGTPTVGQATEGRGAQATESVLSKAPGSAGTLAKKAAQEAAGPR